MSKPLIIVESPAKAKTISKYLDDKFDVKASNGHVRDLPTHSLGINIKNNFEPNYVENTDKKKLINDLKSITKKASAIYLASDHDREGEAIAWHLSEVMKNEIGNKPVYRIVFNEITKSAIKKSINDPGQIDIDKVNSQQARRVLDRIVGYPISDVLKKMLKPKLSAGRVQSVALRLICERDEEIKKFVIEEYYTIESDFFKDKLPFFHGELTHFSGKKVKLQTLEETEKIVREIAELPAKITSKKETQRYIQPPPPYITSTLQQDAAKILNFTGKKTMSVAQKLYEGLPINGESTGLITYMRTDSLRISDEANASLRNFIEQEFGKEKLFSDKRSFKNKNAAQDAHEAIRPTDPTLRPNDIKESLSKDEFKLYELIWKRFVATQMIPIHVSSVSLEITMGKGVFKANGSVILEKGFFEIYPHLSIGNAEEIHKDYCLNDIVQIKKIGGKQHFTKPPAYYSEAQLIKELESKGIGRPSTYASITNTIVTREYVSIIDKRFVPTELGLEVNNFLVSKFDSLFNVSFTAEMESKLDEIEYGRKDWHSLVSDYYQSISSLIDEVMKLTTKETGVKCEKCGKELLLKFRHGTHFLACSGYPKCKNLKECTINDKGEFTMTEAKEEDTGIVCDKCGEKLIIKKTRFGKEFLACNGYPKCKNATDFTRDDNGKIIAKQKEVKESEEKCDKCGKPMLIKKSKYGKDFLACSGYPKCRNAKNLSIDDSGNVKAEKPKISDEKCSKCGKDMIIKSGKFGDFLACSGYPKCKNIKNMSSGIKCPKCGVGEINSKLGKKKNVYFACSKYPDCDFTSFHKVVDQKCVACDSNYLVEILEKGQIILTCPNEDCNKKYY